MSGTAFEPHLGGIPESRNVLEALAHNVRVRPSAPALRTRVAGAWRPLSWASWSEAAREIAAGLAAAGIGPGARVGVLGRDGAGSLAADLGITALGAIAVPLPPGVPPPELETMLRDAEVAALFLAPELAGRLVGIRHAARVVIDLPGDTAVPGDGRFDLEALRHDGRRALAERGAVAGLLAGLPARLTAADPWSILYTAGTTGTPRGLVMSHGGAVYQGQALVRASGLSASDEQLLVLPTAQIFGRVLLQAGMASGMTTVIGRARDFERDVVEIAPACFAAVPEMLERIAARWRAALEQAPMARGATEHALEVGRRVSALRQRGEAVPLTLGVQHRLADRLLFARARARLGGRLRFVVCGGAALRRDLAEFFHGFGVLVLEGYGLTEAGGVVTWNRPERFRFGTVGQALPGCEVHVGDDGELLVRAPSISRRLRDDDGPVDAEGFLHTGDVAELQQGFVRLVGRKRDIIKTASGKLIAPQKIEQRLRGTELIAHAVVLGEGRTRLVALVDIDDAASMAIARREGLGCRSRADLVEHPRIRALVAEAIAEVNATLGKHEAIADFALVAEPLRVSAGELTLAGVPRRQAISARYAALLDGLGAADRA